MNPWIGLIILIVLYPIIKYFINKNMYNNSIKESAAEETNKIIKLSKSIAEYLYEELNIDYDKTLYEMAFLLYCLEVIKIVKSYHDEVLCYKIKDNLFTELEKLNIKENKIILDEVFNRRKMNYLNIYNKNNDNINTKYYEIAFDYQSETIAPDKKDKIKTALLDILPTFKEFYDDVIY